jgi:RNA polymerase sigma-70 factor (ECF subfamily)
VDDFPLTSWGSVIAARDGRERTPHLDRLFRAYWTPVYLFIRRAWGRPEESARDLTQEFFLRLLETDFLKDVDPSKGRFRTYVKACLRHFLLDDAKHARAQKRGGDAKHFSLEGAALPAEPAAAASPEEAFDREWAYAILRDALPELEKALASLGRESAWRVFRALDVDGEQATYDELARREGVSEQAVKSSADYARKMLRRLVTVRIREYSLSEGDAAAELRELFPST